MVSISGDEEAIAALHAAEAELGPMILAAHTEASSLIAGETRRRMRAEYVSESTTGKLAASVQPKATERTIAVTVGNRKTPYAGWWEFGGSTKSPIGNTNRTIERGGRALFPAAAALREPIYAMLDRVSDRIVTIIARGR